MHQILRHASLEVISHVANAFANVNINNTSPAPLTINCKTYSLSKATEVISRQTEVNKLENGTLFNKTT